MSEDQPKPESRTIVMGRTDTVDEAQKTLAQIIDLPPGVYSLVVSTRDEVTAARIDSLPHSASSTAKESAQHSAKIVERIEPLSEAMTNLAHAPDLSAVLDICAREIMRLSGIEQQLAAALDHARADVAKAGKELEKLAKLHPVDADSPAQPLFGMDYILLELKTARQRRVVIEKEGRAFDDECENGELALAAACYARRCAPARIDEAGDPVTIVDSGTVPFDWPFDNVRWMSLAPREALLQAGAYIIAELERLDRLPGARAGAGSPAPEGDDEVHAKGNYQVTVAGRDGGDPEEVNYFVTDISFQDAMMGAFRRFVDDRIMDLSPEGNRYGTVNRLTIERVNVRLYTAETL